MKCVLRKFGWVLRPHAHTSFLCLALSSLRGKAEVFVVEATSPHLQIHNPKSCLELCIYIFAIPKNP